MKVTLFKLKRPKKFSYAPRHFDPIMEDLRSRVNVIESELNQDSKTDSSSLSRTRIRNAWKTPEARKSANKTSNIRIGLIAILLFGFFYAYFFTNFFS